MINKIFISFITFALLINLNADLIGDGTNSNTITSQDEKIVINDIPLDYKVQIIGTSSRFKYDLLDARVVIKSLSNSRHELEYKFVWYDESGFEMGKHLSKWEHIRIDAKDTIILKSLAKTSKVDSFKLYIRDTQN